MKTVRLIRLVRLCAVGGDCMSMTLTGVQCDIMSHEDVTHEDVGEKVTFLGGQLVCIEDGKPASIKQSRPSSKNQANTVGMSVSQ